ncbi:Serine/threonine-protein kinase PknD [Amycolatopsis sp. CA-230715]|nr:Serine/threonine-protein kinase PknD [Amycolatopsis sp. CA-230715]
MQNWVVPGFTEIEPLGEGGFGRVVLAKHTESGTPVAIKYLFARYLADEGHLARFRQEAWMLRRVTSPHVVKLYEFVETPYGAAIVMEAVSGVSLRSIMTVEGAMTPEAALTVLKGSLLGLAAAHAAGTVHRDYKPDNVLVGPDRQSKLVDFGLAVLAGAADAPIGSPAYMAPEQWAGQAATPATDVYAATCVFFQCVTGNRPFRAQDTATLRTLHTSAPAPVGEAPEPVRGLLARGMAKHAADRPASAAAFVAELEAVAVEAYGEDWEDRGWHRLGQRAAALVALSPLAVLGAATALAPGALVAGGAAGGGIVASGGIVGAGTGGTGAVGATLGGGKLIAGVIASVLAVAAAVVTVVTLTGPDDPAPPVAAATTPAPALNVALQTRAERFSGPDFDINMQYAHVTGAANPDVERKLNAELMRPIDARVDQVRRSLVSANMKESDGDIPHALGKADVRMRGPKVISVRYDFSMDSLVLGHASWTTSVTSTVDAETGAVVSPEQVFGPDLTAVTERLRARVPDGFCPGDHPERDATVLSKEALAGHSGQPSTSIAYGPDGVEFFLDLFQLGYTGACGTKNITVPYGDLSALMSPDFKAKLGPAATAPAPPSSSGISHDAEGAATVMENYYKALGAKDVPALCRISAPAWSDQGGATTCVQNFSSLVNALSPAALAACEKVTVDAGKIVEAGKDKVVVPPSAIRGAPPMTVGDDLSLQWHGGTWLIHKS